MAARVMGVRAMVAWEPFFQYAESHVNYEQSAGYNGEFAYNPTPAFHKQFYNLTRMSHLQLDTHRPLILLRLLTTFKVGDRISVSNNTNVRSSGTLSASMLGVQSSPGSGNNRGWTGASRWNRVVAA